MHDGQYSIVLLEFLAPSCICNGIYFTKDMVNDQLLNSTICNIQEQTACTDIYALLSNKYASNQLPKERW